MGSGGAGSAVRAVRSPKRLAPPDIAGNNTMMAASLRSTVVAVGRATLLSTGFAGLGAAIAPTDWPLTMSAYNLHEMSPAMGYAS